MPKETNLAMPTPTKMDSDCYSASKTARPREIPTARRIPNYSDWATPTV